MKSYIGLQFRFVLHKSNKRNLILLFSNGYIGIFFLNDLVDHLSTFKSLLRSFAIVILFYIMYTKCL